MLKIQWNFEPISWNSQRSPWSMLWFKKKIWNPCWPLCVIHSFLISLYCRSSLLSLFGRNNIWKPCWPTVTLYLRYLIIRSDDRAFFVFWSFLIISTAQYPEGDLNKIAKTFNKTYAGLKSTLQRFRIYFFRNPSSKGVESTS